MRATEVSSQCGGVGDGGVPGLVPSAVLATKKVSKWSWWDTISEERTLCRCDWSRSCSYSVSGIGEWQSM